ncbi:TIR domain-containing protein [Vibrio vulnificus]|nr:TIR domain-containing protein [Vibrio vulnificus]
MKQVFISYAWESDEHVEWVKKLGDELEQYEDIHVILDQYDLSPLTDKNKFMEDGVYKSDFVLVVGTKSYARKADDREGGVGEETFLSAANHWGKMLKGGSSNIINLLREDNGTPNYLKGHFYLDFREDDKFDEKVIELLNLINGEYQKQRPTKRKGLSSTKKKAIS